MSEVVELTIERSVCHASWLLKLNGVVLEVCATKREATEQRAWYAKRLGV